MLSCCLAVSPYVDEDVLHTLLYASVTAEIPEQRFKVLYAKHQSRNVQPIILMAILILVDFVMRTFNAKVDFKPRQA